MAFPGAGWPLGDAFGFRATRHRSEGLDASALQLLRFPGKPRDIRDTYEGTRRQPVPGPVVPFAGSAFRARHFRGEALTAASAQWTLVT
jgi:hypothetical protein